MNLPYLTIYKLKLQVMILYQKFWIYLFKFSGNFKIVLKISINHESFDIIQNYTFQISYYKKGVNYTIAIRTTVVHYTNTLCKYSTINREFDKGQVKITFDSVAEPAIACCVSPLSYLGHSL